MNLFQFFALVGILTIILVTLRVVIVFAEDLLEWWNEHCWDTWSMDLARNRKKRWWMPRLWVIAAVLLILWLWFGGGGEWHSTPLDDGW